MRVDPEPTLLSLRRAATLAAAAAATVIALAPVAVAMPTSTPAQTAPSADLHFTTVGVESQAWYLLEGKATCLPIVGCLPLSLPSLPSAFPANSLHIGLTAGIETARSYVVPALGHLPKQAVPQSGTLLLPIDGSPLDGTVRTGPVVMKACLTTGAVPPHPPASGPTSGKAPAVNCKISTPVRYDAPDQRYTVYLDRFLAQWRHGAPERGIAIVPVVKGTAALDTWELTLGGKNAKPLKAVIGYAAHAVDTAPTSRPTNQPTSPPTAVSVPAPPAVTVPLPSMSAVPAPASQPQLAPTPQDASPAAVVLLRSREFRYPMVFLAPLAILAGVVFFSRLFTGTTVQRRGVDGPWLTR